MRIARCRKNLVVINRYTAHRGSRGARAVVIFPNDVAGASLECLHDVAGVVEVDDSVMDDRRGLIGSAFIHRPDPLETEVFHIVTRDLV